MTSGKSGLATESQMATTSCESNPPTPTLATTTEIGYSHVEAGNQQQTAEAKIITKKEVENDEKKEAEMCQDNEPKNAKKQHRPVEYTEGLWEAEPFYYYANGPTTASRGQQQFSQPSDQIDSGEDRRQKRGVVYKHRENLGSANEFECFQSHEGIIYRIGDQVFVESTREEPWLIGCIVSIKMKKRDQLLVKLIRYYRPNDVPELSFSLITHQRIEEGHYHHPSNTPELANQNAKSIHPSLPHSHNSRELFSSESTLLFHVSALRGKCSVKLVKDLRAALAEIDLNDPDSFFNCLNYNQESGRLASVQMSIRVGTAYQADVPSCSTSSLSDDPDRDELLYRPGHLCAETEQKYVKMTRAFRTFTLMNNKRITMLEKSARTGDLLLDDAVTNLHRSGYNIVDAVETMQAIDKHLTSDSSFMSVEDVKKFGKGIKQYGKNFNKINKELLPNHRREQLVAFYYLWKKSRDATRPKPLSNAKRNQVVAAVGRRSKNGQNGGNYGWNGTTIGGGNGQFGNAGFGPKVGVTEMDEGQTIMQNDAKMDNPENLIPPLEELVDYASASETETELLEQQPSGSGRACHHCFSSKSKDWHHAGQHCLLMCTDCRLFYKKYGQLRPVDRPCTVPPCLLANSRQESNEEEDENEEPTNSAGNRIRTRGALAGRQHRPRRTPSSLEVGTEQRLRGTPQKLTEEEEQQRQQRKSTPLRNSTGKSGRKRIFRTAEMDGLALTPTPPKVKRQKKNEESSISTTPCSRTPSPLVNGELAQMGQGGGTKKISKKLANDKESQILRKANANEGKITPPPNSGKLPQNGPSTLSPCSSEPSSSGNMPSNDNNSSGNSPQEIGGNEMKEKNGKMEQNKEELPKNGTQMPVGPTNITKKPVAKVEPMDTKKGAKGVGGGILGTEDQQKEEQPTIICVDLSEEDGDDVETTEMAKEWEQDTGPVGEPDSTEIYRTAEGKKNYLGEVISPEGRTILVRQLRRTSGLTCTRTDIAFLEPAERTKHNQQKREKERQKKEQEKMNKQIAANNNNQQQKMQQQSQIGMGNGAKKQFPQKQMEMPAEFVPSAAALHPMAALLMNGIGPSGHHHTPQTQILHQQHIPQSSLPSTSSHQSILPPTPISSHYPPLSVVNGQQHVGANANANHALLSQTNASMNPTTAAAFLQQQQQHEQALIMQMMTMERGFMAQLQAMLQQPSQHQQQQQQQMMQTLLNINQLEQLQKQQQQHQKQQQQAQAMHRPQTAMHLNGQQHPSTSHSQHPSLVNGITNHHAMGGHKLSTGNAPQQQFKDSTSQKQAASVAMMSQLLGVGNVGSQQKQENHQNQQQQAATLIALQQQQQRLQNSNQSNLSNGINAQQNAQHNLMNATQSQSTHHHLQFQHQNQQQQANLAAEMAAITAAIQQQQNGSSQQQQQIQHLMTAFLGNGSSLPANEQRVFEEQIKMHLLNQQHQQQQMAAAAAAVQQQQQFAQAQAQQQQTAATQQQQNAQAQQQQQLFTVLATLGGMPGGAEQIMAQMGQQIAIQQQNQQQQTASASAASHQQQQQFQQQIQQVMAHQHHNQQQQIEMIRRMMYQHPTERR